MFTRTNTSRRFGVLGAAAALLLVPAAAMAVALVAWAYDPTAHDIYYQFSTDIAIDAWHSEVIENATGKVVKFNTWDPAGTVKGGSGQHHNLKPVTNYTLKVYYGTPPGPWTLVKVQPFVTK